MIKSYADLPTEEDKEYFSIALKLIRAGYDKAEAERIAEILVDKKPITFTKVATVSKE